MNSLEKCFVNILYIDKINSRYQQKKEIFELQNILFLILHDFYDDFLQKLKNLCFFALWTIFIAFYKLNRKHELFI